MVPSLDALTLEEKIGQLFVPATSPDVERLVRERHVGGVIWFASTVGETAALNRRLQRLARIPLLISADLEAGLGMRFTDTTFFPPAMAIAATGDPSFSERLARRTAIEARALGINHVFAPVCDVNVNRDNPVINARSFGEDPEEVAKYANAFIRGLQSEGVLATAKHFPGHGDTHIDSHRSMPTVAVTRERLDRVELAPFRAAIAAGVAAVMVGHLAVPALDDGGMPATLSRRIVDGVLRRELGYRGLVVSDAFDMGGITERFSAAEAAVMAINAGIDQVLMSPDIDAAIDAVRANVPATRIDEAVARILDAKRRAPVTVAADSEIWKLVDTRETRQLALDIARRAITAVRPGRLLNRSSRVALIVVSEIAEAASPLPQLEVELRNRLTHPPDVIFLDANAPDARAAANAAQLADVALVALAVRAKSGAGTIAVPAVARAAIDRMQNVIAVSFGSPYLLSEIPKVATYICAYGIQPPLQLAATEALFGDIDMKGTLPVTIR